MQRRLFLRNTALTLGAIHFLNFDSIASMLADPAYKIRMLTNDVGIFTERGGTILFMLNKKGPIIVDAQFPDTAPHLIKELQSRSKKEFRLLINTHHHGDHTSGNIAFKGLVPHVLAHANSLANQRSVAEKANTLDKQLLPDQTYTNEWCEKIGKENICMHYYGPGHTNGDSLVHFQHRGVIHMGDLVFNRRHPVIDMAGGASIANWVKVLEQTTSNFADSVKYVCGHAAEGYDVVLTSADLLAFRDYLGNLLKYTSEAIAAGKTKAEILAATTIPGSPEWKGDGIQRTITAAYTELGGK